MPSGVYVQRHRAETPGALRYLGDLWHYRYLCLNLVQSDLRSRFRRSTLGLLWGVLQPLSMSLVLAWVFSALFGQSFSTFLVYILSGFIVWDVFTTSANVGIAALDNGAGHLRQARVPLFVFQLRVAISALVFFSFGLAALAIAMIATGVFPPASLAIVQFIPFMALLALFVIPVSIFMSILGVSFRDAAYITPIVLQLVFLTSPILIPRDVFAKPQIAILQFINPMTPLLDAFRAIVLEARWLTGLEVGVVAGWIVAAWTVALLAAAIAGRAIVFKL